MSLARETLNDAAIGVGVANTPEGLSAIHQPGCAAAIWRRSPNQAVQSWVDGLDPKELPKARVILPPARIAEAPKQICDTAGTPACPERDALNAMP